MQSRSPLEWTKQRVEELEGIVRAFSHTLRGPPRDERTRMWVSGSSQDGHSAEQEDATMMVTVLAKATRRVLADEPQSGGRCI